MFKEIKIVGRDNKELVAFIKTDTIVGMTEIKTEPTKLYDEDGNLVSEEPSPRLFVIAVSNDGRTYNLPFAVGEDTYNELKDLLTK